jgi:3'(2'), 5'-bisphosphate nucleotidase
MTPKAHQLSTTDLEALCKDAHSLAAQAAHAIMAVYAQAFSVDAKADASPLTEADLASHRILETGLKGLDPRFPVLSEESSERVFADRLRWKRFWLIDPLDGTREFVSRNGEFAINIALIECLPCVAAKVCKFTTTSHAFCALALLAKCCK